MAVEAFTTDSTSFTASSAAKTTSANLASPIRRGHSSGRAQESPSKSQRQSTAFSSNRSLVAGILTIGICIVFGVDRALFGGQQATLGRFSDLAAWLEPVTAHTGLVDYAMCGSCFALVFWKIFFTGNGSGAKATSEKDVRKLQGSPGPRQARGNFSPGNEPSPSLVDTPSKRRPSGAETTRWNQLIDLAARQGDITKAGELLLELESSDSQPDAVSYNLVIRACAKTGDVLGAEKWLRRMETRGIEATVCSYNTVLDACAKADKAEMCEAWLRRMLEKGIEANVISYATAIYARAKRGDVAVAEDWLQQMIAAGIEPDVVSFNSLIHAYGVNGNSVGAEHWLQEMRDRGLAATVTTYTAVIDACAKSGNVERGEKWLTKMIADGVEPNVVSYSAMIAACAKSNDLERAEYWHDQMTERGITANAHSYSAVINACAKSGNVDAAERWLHKSELSGVANDVVVYSSVIDACGKAGDSSRAMEVFRRMQAQGIRPHIVAYAGLARPFAYQGNWQQVESIAAEMKTARITSNEYFLYAQLLSYATARPRQSQRAEQCFRDALAQGVYVNDHVVGALARCVGRPQCVELMNELCNGREVPNPPSRRENATNLNAAGGRQRTDVRRSNPAGRQ